MFPAFLSVLLFIYFVFSFVGNSRAKRRIYVRKKNLFFDTQMNLSLIRAYRAERAVLAKKSGIDEGA